MAFSYGVASFIGDYLVRRGIGLPEMTRVDLPTRRVRWQWSCPQDVPRPWSDGDHPQRLQLDSCTCIDVATRSASRPFARRQESSHSAGGSGSCGLKSESAASSSTASLAATPGSASRNRSSPHAITSSRPSPPALRPRHRGPLRGGGSTRTPDLRRAARCPSHSEPRALRRSPSPRARSRADGPTRNGERGDVQSAGRALRERVPLTISQHK